MTKTIIKLPVRGRECEHLLVFDLFKYLEANKASISDS